MGVKKWARDLAATNPAWAYWPHRFPTRVAHFANMREDYIFRDAHIDVGEDIHSSLCSYFLKCGCRPAMLELCKTAEAVLAEHGAATCHPEQSVRCDSLAGVVDLSGRLVGGGDYVCEIKTTSRDGCPPPTPEETIQLAAYATLMDQISPKLVLLRIAPFAGLVSLFEHPDPADLIHKVVPRLKSVA